MKLDQKLVDEALSFAKQRFGEGPYCVAALRTKTGRILTSVYFESDVEGASLCAETGAICEAERLNEAVVASVCIGRSDKSAPPYILPACGVCQERLAKWGGDVEVAIPDAPSSLRWSPKTLKELQPFHWKRLKARGPKSLK